ncbi:MAG: cytochrome c oxidase, cbb3-type, CcoQ subunit [Campylobacter lanienae]|uniref:cytochrome c oxidase, cbb3-type, CcoQ subunit n=1 Tax=Campylobacter lanienae TaxID=75658 RepID=UPI002431E9A8|nr:cytochrome c oxidase, cbb3-type, CcoQ subunit [Campylobacter lanienae]MCI5540091.1 cytochrome c oxidase, cbb3-type, CcoQ subunit [Campylobacter lanienae]MDD7514435.1 cytochrome c oxidase, cbb3-type, CcoQ subunit [Campylobacter lanienae]MDY3133279.1 cytochrome c oxidase, cbb3-type, CcoQ subunit [Campylobacter lanienae]MDY5518903.1 cytochrome c oxidase, cbb3-type, CcoQ subunit [Campylobacter lanienae]MDY6057453.1 cytochrome c oxidase, cbb3-type, CcoQ subunit [Campylobacter lanienae]
MSIETIRELQAYGFYIMLVVMVVILYSYWFHLKRSEKTGRRDYEKYSNLALNDDLKDNVLESLTSDKDDNRSVKK